MEKKFCGNCGSKLDEMTGLCPKCDKNDNKKELRKQKKIEKKNLKKQKKKEKWAAKTFGQKVGSIILKIVAVVLIFLLLVLGILGALVYKGVVEVPVINTLFDIFGIEEIYEVEMIDVEAYYEENAKIVNRVRVKESKDVYSEQEVFELLSARGFTEYEITTEYSMDGEYYDTINVSKDSKEEHPIYSTHYISEEDIVWNITVVNGTVMATPISYNLEQEGSVKVIFSETVSITGYDSVTNMFYEIEPKATFANVIKVELIDSKTLDTLTYEKIEDLT